MRVVLADDHVLFRQGLRGLLEAKGVDVVGEAGTVAETLSVTRAENPDVLLLDLRLPDASGLEVVRQLSREKSSVRVVVLTASEEESDLLEALRAGAIGYVVKDTPPESFLELIERAARGLPALQGEQLSRALRGLSSAARADARPKASDFDLTPRELEVLELLAAGTSSTAALAEALGVSENTVKFHVRNILDKLQLGSRTEAVSFALRHGLVSGRPTC